MRTQTQRGLTLSSRSGLRACGLRTTTATRRLISRVTGAILLFFICFFGPFFSFQIGPKLIGSILTHSRRKINEWAVTCGSFLRRYSFEQRVATTRTSRVDFARDELAEEGEAEAVCLKRVKERSPLEFEVQRRHVEGVPLSSNAVIQVLRWHTPADEPFSFAGETSARQCTEPGAEYPYVLVMERGECSLHEACHRERFARYEVEKVLLAMGEIARCVKVLHDVEMVHGDLKQRNVLQLRSHNDKLELKVSYALCDLDTSNAVGHPLGPASMAYAPPELARRKFTCGCSGFNRACSKCCIKKAEKSFDVWSIGVILFEMCAGRPLFHQDVANDDLVDDADRCRLCVWQCVDDDELDPAFSSRTTACEHTGIGHIQSDAKDLIRWCLQGDPQKRPTIDEVLSHRFLKPEGGSIPRGEDGLPSNRMKYHAFMSHAQADASGTVGTLYLQYKLMGLHNWLDMRQDNLNAEGMKQGSWTAMCFCW